jgi:hypothetical protein
MELPCYEGPLSDFLDNLFERSVELVDAIVAEGWSEPMAREGLQCHRDTWDVELVVAQVRRELEAFRGGGDGAMVTAPESIVHIWPRLPGAGVTPVLYGALLGAPQWVRPPSDAVNFAELFVEVWRASDVELPELRLLEPSDDWTFGDVVVVSGTDRTLVDMRRELLEARGPRAARLTGYGHRVSFGVVPRASQLDLEAITDDFARDAVLWNQSGCFSLQGVLFEGSDSDHRRFCRELGDRIEVWEQRLDARPENSAMVARRVQKKNTAEFETMIFGDGFGWVQPSDQPFGGATDVPHVVSTHRLDGPESLDDRITPSARHLQAAALPETEHSKIWRRRLADLGVTRICPPGELQSPRADWLHDGRPNISEWLRSTTLE